MEFFRGKRGKRLANQMLLPTTFTAGIAIGLTVPLLRNPDVTDRIPPATIPPSPTVELTTPTPSQEILESCAIVYVGSKTLEKASERYSLSQNGITLYDSKLPLETDTQFAEIALRVDGLVPTLNATVSLQSKGKIEALFRALRPLECTFTNTTSTYGTDYPNKDVRINLGILDFDRGGELLLGASKTTDSAFQNMRRYVVFYDGTNWQASFEGFVTVNPKELPRLQTPQPSDRRITGFVMN
ncbi:MAG: hypothetical protein HYV40_00060 [Candidatus Levybacteria bacterium]|nr:hypothetical protein [Candidatus Levybacteria bacterium]